MKKLFGYTMAVLMVVSLFCGCTNGGDTDKPTTNPTPDMKPNTTVTDDPNTAPVLPDKVLPGTDDEMMPDTDDGVVEDKDGVITEEDNASHNAKARLKDQLLDSGSSGSVKPGVGTKGVTNS